MSMCRGVFIVIEGLDRSGKSSQAERLAAHLRQNYRSIIVMRFPDRTTESGREIDAYLRNVAEKDDRTIHELFSKNRWEFAEKIRSKLESGVSIVCDRYAFSGVAYSAAKGLDLKECMESDRGLPAPDVVLYLNAPPEELSKRGKFGGERYEKLEFQRKVASSFELLFVSERNVFYIDALQNPDAVHNDIFAALVTILRAKLGPIVSLWSDVS